MAQMSVVNLVNNPLLTSGVGYALASEEILSIQISCLVIFIALIALASKKSRGVRSLPSFWVAVGWGGVYLIPSILLGGNVMVGMPDPFPFLLIINAIPIALATWLLFYSHFVGGRDIASNLKPETECRSLILLGSGALIIVIVWLCSIPFNCTAGWALIFDPERTLLAREVSGKLSNTPIISRMIGAYVNVVAPLFIFLGGFGLIRLARQGKLRAAISAVVLAGLMCASFLSLFLTGAKSNVLPLLVLCTVAVVLMPLSNVMKLFAAAVITLFVIGSIVLFQGMIQEARPSERYMAGRCMASFGTCEEGRVLIETASARGSHSILGKSNNISYAAKEFEASCNLELRLGQGGANRGLHKNTDIDVDLNVDTTLDGLLTRAVKVPFQVAAWYYLWGIEVGQTGLNAIPIIGRFYGNVNVAKEVYQRYGAIYSSGDITSTSTAPTTFLIAYPALMGWLGFFLAIAFLVLFDFVCVLFLRKIAPPLSYGFAGLAAVMAYHFLNTDFFTVIGSQGGFAFIALALFTALLYRPYGVIRLPKNEHYPPNADAANSSTKSK